MTSVVAVAQRPPMDAEMPTWEPSVSKLAVVAAIAVLAVACSSAPATTAPPAPASTTGPEPSPGPLARSGGATPGASPRGPAPPAAGEDPRSHSDTAAPSPDTAAPPAPDTAAPAPDTAAPTASPVCTDPLGCYAAPEMIGSYDFGAVPEASGLAASVRNPGVWWLLDDGPATQVWALTATGETIGAVVLDGFRARDAEDLAVAPCGPAAQETCVYVADIGDNLARRDRVRIARFPEPDLAGGVSEDPVAVAVAAFTYPDLPVDAEALLVGQDGVPLIVTKENGAARLLAAPAFADGTLVDLGPAGVPPPRRPALSRIVGDVVTAGDGRPGRVLLRTYDHVVEYVAPDSGAPLSTFPSWPVREVPAPVEPQSEAIAYLADGTGYATVSEGSGALWLVRRSD